MFDTPIHWNRGGLVFARKPKSANEGWSVVGDPCIVWDEKINGWRMFLFYDPPGHAQAICKTPSDIGPGRWELEGPLTFTNPQDARPGGTHKPYIIQEAGRPNHAAFVENRYWLLSVGGPGVGRKFIHRAWSHDLAGPWTWEPGMLIPPGDAGDWDGKHTDAISGLYFPDRGEFLYFYMGYPKVAQLRRISPFGSAQGVASQRVGEASVQKLGIILPPAQQDGHWASGWVGGLQVLPGKKHRWIGLANASPTAPRNDDNAVSREEPPPSLGGFAWCDEEWPIKNWHWADEPIEVIDQIPPEALAAGEGVNLWRHHLIIPPTGPAAIFYNTGSYGQEQLFMKWAAESR